jgi:hypothetical protein
MADMSVASCILPLRYRGPDGAGVRVKRRKMGAIVKGVPYEAPADILQIVATIQQASERELLRLPEGDRTKDYIYVHTEFELRTADVQNGFLPDRVCYGGREWEVMKIDDRNPSGGNYMRALCVKVGQ